MYSYWHIKFNWISSLSACLNNIGMSVLLQSQFLYTCVGSSNYLEGNKSSTSVFRATLREQIIKMEFSMIDRYLPCGEYIKEISSNYFDYKMNNNCKILFVECDIWVVFNLYGTCFHRFCICTCFCISLNQVFTPRA